MRCKRCCRPRPTRRSLSWRFWQSNSSICFSIWSWHFFIASHSILIVDNCWAWSTHGHTDTEKKQLVQGQALWDCCSRYKWRQKKIFDAFKKKKKGVSHMSQLVFIETGSLAWTTCFGCLKTLSRQYHAESWQSLLLPALKVEVNTVFIAQAAAAFQVSENTAIIWRQLPRNWRVRYNTSTLCTNAALQTHKV